MLPIAVNGREPKSCHTGHFVEPLYWIMTENPTILAEIGHGGEPKSRHQYPPWPIFDNTRKELSSPCKIKIIHHLTVILEPYQLIEKDSFDIATKRCQYFPTRISYSIKKANNQHNITNSKLKNHTIAASHFNRGDVL